MALQERQTHFWAVAILCLEQSCQVCQQSTGLSMNNDSIWGIKCAFQVCSTNKNPLHYRNLSIPKYPVAVMIPQTTLWYYHTTWLRMHTWCPKLLYRKTQVMCSQTLTRHYPSRCLCEPTSWSKSLAIQKQNAYLIISILLHLIVDFGDVSASTVAHSATLEWIRRLELSLSDRVIGW